MGYRNALDAAQSMDRDQAIRYHLGANCYPPIHPAFDVTAMMAIDLAKAGEWDNTIVMPNGIEKTVSEIIEGLHLEAFLDTEEE